MAKNKNEATKRLFSAIASIQTEKECEDFLEDLCTIKEIQDMAQRFDTALLLNRGKSYQKIAEETGVSTATISRVNRCLTYGTGGYRKALERLGEKKNGNL